MILGNFRAKLDQNCTFGLKQDFLGNVTLMIFIYLFCLIMLQSLKKILSVVFQKYCKVKKFTSNTNTHRQTNDNKLFKLKIKHSS